MIKRTLLTTLFCCLVNILILAQEAPFRPPAVPLVTFNPYLSIWSEADKLTDVNTQHWTHREHALASLIRIDGRTYRLMGALPTTAPAFNQVSVKVWPTRTIYEFEQAGVHVTLSFLTAALPNDLEVFSRPLSYITWDVHSVDGKAHKVLIYNSTSSELAVNDNSEQVGWSRQTAGNLTALRVGTQTQNILGASGDDQRINWGYAYVAAQSNQATSAIGAVSTLMNNFVINGRLPSADDSQQPRAVSDQTPVMAFVFNVDSVRADIVERQVIVAYDEIYAINYFQKKLRPYWRRNGQEPADLLQTASNEYSSLLARCKTFDEDLVADLTRVGGAHYAQIAALAYRECMAACGLAADDNNQPLFFTKENTSNGDIATVDVFFPMNPIWILLSPTLAKASLVPILSYASSSHWKFPNAPHDLGTYPIALGTDGGGEGMPVEESGNMLILCDAIAHAEGNADFVAPWWDKLSQWASYLEQYGLDPEDQLCTDDFMGHLAHNSNLSIKAILGLAAYGDLCKMRGDLTNSSKYALLAKNDAAHWMTVADDGDHYRLAFDMPGTWSQKYNLVWDKLLGLNIFPASVAKKEIAYYKTVLQTYGLPLDSRTHLSKADWSIWCATMTENQADFDAIVTPEYNYFNNTSTRDPLSDSYITDDVNSGGMHARPVVGGFFIKMLSDSVTWRKWVSYDKQKASGWAPLPQSVVTEVVPTSQKAPINWDYTTTQPADNWMNPTFTTTGWQSGPAGFGTVGTPNAIVGTTWSSSDIWIRRSFTMPAGSFPNLEFNVYHDEDIEIYINGILAGSASGYTTSYQSIAISQAALDLLIPGAQITLAVHCHQTAGGQCVDVGICNVTFPSATNAVNIIETPEDYIVSPNPSKGLITISSQNTESVELKLLNIQGGLLFENKYQTVPVTLNLQKYADCPGEYFLLITNHQKTIAKKVMLAP